MRKKWEREGSEDIGEETRGEEEERKGGKNREAEEIKGHRRKYRSREEGWRRDNEVRMWDESIVEEEGEEVKAERRK